MNRDTFRYFISQKNYLIYMKERITEAVLELEDLKTEGASDKVLELMNQFIDLLKKDMKEAVQKVNFVVDSIEAVKDQDCKQVLKMRYIEGQSMKQIAEQTGKSQTVLYMMQEKFFNDLGI